MAGSILSSIIFFLLFIVLSHFVEAHMEHRKLSGAKETMSARRNLEGNGGSKIRAPPSFSPHSGQKNTHNEPSKTHPNQARHQVRTISYAALNRTTTLECRIYENCIRHVSP
ncbi:uncharacterized protein LOC108819388 isoform X2 [Raphanus sativus]|uniref:Uncharacterized protein LOC108819388 isoform X2 n=1 Tax=Raphanus sativus TaxID=3726 RepID=A0A6J0KJZ3_RAPSA|nr:uncharacterized protein LOC108819388 isoform X2 [Raphanus sativus]